MGLAFDMLYTLKLKRATPWSILLGGIAGGMPVLAGRVLATGKIDLAGIMLALAVVCWIPTHIVTFAIKHARDYERAGVPVVPNKYGVAASRRLVAASTALAAILILTVSWILGLKGSYLIAIAILCGLLITGAMAALLVRQPLLDHLLFKAASFFMLISSILITLGVGPSRW
jgi:protoheme IX farnesyltransferase